MHGLELATRLICYLTSPIDPSSRLTKFSKPPFPKMIAGETGRAQIAATPQLPAAHIAARTILKTVLGPCQCRPRSAEGPPLMWDFPLPPGSSRKALLTPQPASLKTGAT